MISFIEGCPVGEELFHANRGTDMTKLRVAFRNYVKAPEKGMGYYKKNNHKKYFYCCGHFAHLCIGVPTI